MTNQKVEFKSELLVEIVKAFPFFAEEVGHQIFKDSPFVTIQVALKHVGASAGIKQSYQEADVCDINFETVFDCVTG